MRKSFFDRLTGGAIVNGEAAALQSEAIRPQPQVKMKPATPRVPEPEKVLPKSAEHDWAEETESEAELTIDVYQSQTHLVVQSAVAGVKNDDLDIGVQNGMLTIRGKRTKDEEVREEDYYTREIYWGSFSRSILLPEDLDLDRVDAKIRGGMLTVKIPKQDKKRVRKIVVKGTE